MPKQLTLFTNKQHRFLLWLSLAFTLWWLGVGPSDLFALPAFICLLEISLWIIKGEFYSNFTNLQNLLIHLLNKKKIRTFVIGFFAIQVTLWLLIVICRYYSFQMSTFDSGIFSNLIYNATNGEIYSSFLRTHSFAIHFSPSLYLLTFFYKIEPSFHWMMGAKLLSFAVTPIIFYRVLRFEIKDIDQARFWTLILTSGWLILYSPVVNSMRFEFQPNSLSLPFVAGFYLMVKKDRWVWAAILGILLLGFKENFGAVLIGVGLHRLLVKERPVQAVFMVFTGIAAIYLITYQVMPYVQEYKPVWSIKFIDPFADPLDKLLYLAKLVVPLGLIPVIFWRNGIMAGPAIGVNLISSMPQMYSAHYHYDDMSGTLLFLSLILSIKDLKKNGLPFTLPKTKVIQTVILLCIAFGLTELPRSAPRYFFSSMPQGAHFDLEKEILDFNQEHPNEDLVVQDFLGPHFMRRNIRVLSQQHTDVVDLDTKISKVNQQPITYHRCDENFTRIEPEDHVDYLILSTLISTYQIPKIDQCIRELENSSDFQKIPGYQHLIIFKKI